MLDTVGDADDDSSARNQTPLNPTSSRPKRALAGRRHAYSPTANGTATMIPRATPSTTAVAPDTGVVARTPCTATKAITTPDPRLSDAVISAHQKADADRTGRCSMLGSARVALG